MRATQAGAATLCLVTTAASLTATTVLRPPDIAAAAERAPTPNVILISADDLGYDQVSLNKGPISMPTVDERIADRGVQLTDGYTASPVCSPSRTAILTGRHASRFGNDSNFQNRTRPKRVPDTSIANILPDSYNTKAVGKWDIAGFEENRSSKQLPHNMAFDKFYGVLGGLSQYCDSEDKKTSVTRWSERQQDYVKVDNPPYLTDAFSDNAADFVRNNINKSDPYFLYLSYTAPHTPLQSAESCPDSHHDAQTYADMVRTMDDGIGRVLDAAQREASDTMVVFVSDHGTQFPEFFNHDKLRGGKYGLFEGGVRVPMVLKWPAGLSQQGQAFGKPVSTLDLLPTIAAAAGRNVDDDYPGRNIVPTLNNGTDVPHERLFWRYVTDTKTSRGAAGVVKIAIRSGQYKYVRHALRDGSIEEWLFDLSQDKDENNNLVDSMPDVTKRLIAEHNHWNSYNRLNEAFQHVQPNRPPDGFIAYVGDWDVGGGSYTGTADGAAGRAMVAGSYYQEVNAGVDVRLQTKGHAGLIVRGGLDALSGYVVRLAVPRDGQSKVILTRMKGGQATATHTEPRAIQTDTTYRLRVKAVGDTITVWVNGNQAMQWTDPNPLPGGSIGLRVVGGKASFDQLRAHRAN